MSLVGRCSLHHYSKPQTFKYAKFNHTPWRAPLSSCNTPLRSATLTKQTFTPKQSGTGTLTLAVAFAGLLATGAYLLRPAPAKANEAEPKATQVSPLLEGGYTAAELSVLGMPITIPPGRPGNLTPEQEATLRDFWGAVLSVFGVYKPSHAAETPRVSTTDSPDASDADLGKKKKSRLGFLRKNHDKEGGSGHSSPADSDIDAEDDKYGQTAEFKQALASMKPEDLRRAFWNMVKHDHPDGLLLRFLRARKWDVQKALVMMVSTMHWRLEEMHVDDDVMVKGEAYELEASKSGTTAAAKKEGEDFIAQIRMGKSFLHGVDAQGRPICYVRVRLHRQGDQSESSLERYTVYTIETARMLLRPPVDTATIIFDMTDFSLKNMDYTPVKFMIKCFEANYPESLGTVLVHKSPWVFQSIWSIIRGWLDPVVAGKVHFTKNMEELSQFIPKSHIITELGGEENWSYVYKDPIPGENDTMKDTATRDRIESDRAALVKEYEAETLEWVQSGAVLGEDKRRSRNETASRLKDNYWKLDPYVRARTLYDRTGVIGKNGEVDFYPQEKKAVAHSSADDDVD